MSRIMQNLKGIGVRIIPRFFFQNRLKYIFKEILNYDDKTLIELKNRVNYYNKINKNFNIHNSKHKESIHKFPKNHTSYAFDSYKISKYFNNDYLWIKAYGDINTNLIEPSICKSRLIDINNHNNIILKLDSNRHFAFVKDRLDFENKKNIAIYRGAIYQTHRINFINAYFDKNFIDIGHTGTGLKHFKKNKLSKQKQMEYKFIISLEGNDVASNLKWAMNSNSLVFAPKMHCETWFMEANLRDKEHFVECDNTNLQELIEYYNTHTKEAKDIINNAHKYVKPFLDKKKEFHISILVLAKYFYYSNQLDLSKNILNIIKDKQ